MRLPQTMPSSPSPWWLDSNATHSASIEMRRSSPRSSLRWLSTVAPNRQCAASHFGPTAHSYLMRVSPPCCSGWTAGEPTQPKNGSPSIRSSPSPKHSKKSSPTSPIRAPVGAFTEMLNSTDVDRRVPRPRPNVYCGRSPLSRCYRADLPGAPP